MRSANLSKITITVLKLTVFLACLFIGFRYLQKHEPDRNNLHLTKSAAWILPGIVFLAILNWGFEAFKWYKLINLIKPISYKTAVKATLSGVATSFITPFRVGDFFGRVIHLKSHKKTASVLTFYGNFTQLLATLLFGIIGYGFGSHPYEYQHNDGKEIFIVIGAFLLLMGYYMALFPKEISSWIKLKDWLKFDSGLHLINRKVTLYTTSLSLLRYAIFMCQFLMAYRVFGSQLEISILFYLISTLYLFITFLPSPLMGKLGVRESVALFLIGPFESSEVIIAASLLVWLINLFIPAIIGSTFLMKIKSVKSE